MEVLYFCGGFLLGNLFGYGWYLIGRKTKYQDQNIAPPPNPIKIIPDIKVVKKLEEAPPGYVDELTDPAMTNYRPNQEL
jgi:hypothetical protein